jgi:hypothetical protein
MRAMLAALALFCAAPAYSSTITYQFEGRVTSILLSPIGGSDLGLSIGDAVSMRVAFSPQRGTAPIPDDPCFRENTIADYRLNVRGVSIFSTGGATTSACNLVAPFGFFDELPDWTMTGVANPTYIEGLYFDPGGFFFFTLNNEYQIDEFDGIWESYSVVPEPSTLALLSLGLLGAGVGARRRALS